jgi:hydroxymethylpyrimidine pyrophosphatase-like HAD family hydrolase
MLTGKEYLDSIQSAIQEEIDTELQRLQYFLKANARIHNTRFPFMFPVRNCRLEVIEALANHLIEAGWSVEKSKEYLQIMPLSNSKNNHQPPVFPRK